ncbi:SpvB/TcaC N-terminal domain-containing protein [Myroides odoratus]|uniref:SpvB/TcaC N-terminal domain-containing protein n=1 Tax=Myroides odoratus TaxID=256 RepID=UPI0039AFE5F2
MIVLSFFYSTVIYPIQAYAETLSSVDLKIAQSTSFFRGQEQLKPEYEGRENALGETVQKEYSSVVESLLKEEKTKEDLEVSTAFTQVYAADLDYGIIGSQYGESDDPIDNFFDISILESIDLSKAYYLEYTVLGVNSLSSLARSINGYPALGNNLVSYSSTETVIKERINPALLVKGNNRIFFNVNNSSGIETRVSQVKLLQEEIGNSSDSLVLTHVQRTEEGRLYVRGFATSQQTASLRYKMTPIQLAAKKEFEAIVDYNSADTPYLVFQEAGLAMQQIDLTAWLKKTAVKVNTQYAVTEPNLGKRFPIAHDQENHMAISGAAIQFPEQAIGEQITEIQVAKLRKIDLAPQGAGIINITKNQQGYRFLPDGSTFEKDGLISIEFDENLVPNGTKHEDIHIFYFDESSKKWVAIPKDQVLAEQGMVRGLTNHFTDYIAGVIQMPESPDYSGFTPTGARNLPAAKPTDKINFVEMPEASSTGDANVSYPIEIPAGRKGMQPSLSLSYSSGSGSSGWVGLGWDLNVPSIEVNTTWGAATYDTNQESELYSFNGEDLVLVTQGGEYAPNRDDRIARVANATFAPRLEGNFNKIQRLGTSPSTYTWVVTTKAGVKYYYGSVAQARLTTGIGTQGNIVKWMLTKVEDLNGNYIEYQYELKNFTTGSLIDGKQLYLKAILYTKHANGSVNNMYKISFNRTNTVGGSAREDKSFSIRRGVKEVEDDLLSEIVVSVIKFAGENQIRKYVLSYQKGAFGKTLLRKVDQMYNSVLFHSHEFEYHNEIANGELFAPRARVETQVDFSGVFNKLKASASAIGGGQGEYKEISGGVYAGYASIANPATLLFVAKYGTVGITGFSNSSQSEAIIALMDVDGDGLPDKVFKADKKLYYRKNLNGHFSRLRSPILGQSNFSKSKTKTVGAGLEASLIAYASGRKSWSETKIPIYVEDVNHDGLPDIVNDGQVFFNSLSNYNRTPYFHENSSQSSNPIFTAGAITVSPPPELPIPRIPTVDVVKMWEASIDGTINISGAIKLANNSQLAYYSIERGNVNQTGNTTFLRPITAVSRTNTATAFSAVTVQKGDRFFFRVISSADKADVAVEWNPKVSYTATADQNYTDANNLKPYVNSFSESYLISGFAPIEIKENGTYAIQADSFVVDNSVGGMSDSKLSDEVVLVIKRFKLNTTNPSSTNLYLPIHAGALIDVYKQRIKLNELNTIPALNYSFTVSDISSDNANSMQYIKAEIQSSSNVNWQSISSKWNPKITDSEGLLDKGLVPELSIYNKEYRKQAVSLTLTAKTPFRLNHTLSFSGCDGTCTIGDVYFIVKNGKGEVLKETPTSNQYIKYRFKYSGGALKNIAKFNATTGNYDAVATSITQTIFELVPVNNDALANKIYFEWFSENPKTADKFTVNANQAVVKLTYAANGTINATPTTSVTTTVLGKQGNTQFGPMYRGWGAFAYKSISEVENRTEPINQKVLSNEGAQQGLNPESPDLSEAEMRECENHDIYEDYMECVEQKRNRGGGSTSTQDVPPRLYVLLPNKELNRWQLNDKMFISALTSSPYLERLAIDLRDTPDPNGDFGRDREIDGSGVGLVTSHEAKSVIKYIRSVSKGYTAGVLVVSYSDNKVEGKAINDFRDINGDGYPDIIGDRIQLTNEKGGLTQRMIAKNVLQDFKASGSGVAASTPSGTQMEFIANNFGNSKNPTPAVKDGGTGSAMSVNASYFSTNDFVSNDLVDLNGDGLPDYIQRGGAVALNYGSSFKADNTWGTSAIKESKTTTYSGGGGMNLFAGAIAGGFSIAKNITEDVTSLLDINGDGLPDKIVGGNTVYLNTGTGFSNQAIVLPVSSSKESKNISGGVNINGTYCIYFLAPIVFTGPKICFSVGFSTGKTLNKETVQIMDFNGDGYPDILVSDSEGDLQVAYSRIGKTNLLKTVKRPLGGVIQIDYDNKNPGEAKKIGLNYAMPFTKWVMTQASIYDGYEGDGESTMRRSFSYYKGFKDRRERRFLGFGEVVTNELDRLGDVYRSVKEEYLINELTESEAYGPGLNPMIRQYYFKKGLLSKQTLYDKYGRIYSKTLNEYQFFKVNANSASDYTLTSGGQISFDEKKIYLPLLRSVTTSKYEFNSTQTTGFEQRTKVYFDRYDRYGNLTRYRDVGDSQSVNPADLITVNISYHYNTTNYLVSIPKIHEVLVDGQNRKVESEIDARGNTIGFKKYWSPTQFAPYTFQYDVFGNLIEKKHPMIGSSQYIETITYDPLFNMYPQKLMNNRGAITHINYDISFGVPGTISVNGFASLTYVYDFFGRIDNIGSASFVNKIILRNTYNLQYNPQQRLYPYVFTERSKELSDFPSSITAGEYYKSSVFTDGLGRAIQTKQELDKEEYCSANVGYRLAVSGKVVYDEFGRSTKSSLPSEEIDCSQSVTNGITRFSTPRMDTNNSVEVIYDEVDRPKSERVLGIGAVTSYVYGYDKDCWNITQFKKEVTLPEGNTSISYFDAKGRNTSTKQIGDNQTLCTQFTYNALGSILNVTDAEGKQTAYTYNSIGQLLAKEQVDRGVTKYTYDAIGQVIKLETSNLMQSGQSIMYQYNKELLEKEISGDAITYYTYNQDLLTKVVDNTVEDEFIYGTHGDIIEQKRKIQTPDGYSYTSNLSFIYDFWGRVASIIYPDGEKILYQYDKGGLLKRITNADNFDYIKSITYDHYGNRKKVKYGNNVETEYFYSHQQRLRGLTLRRPNNELFTNVLVSYDQNSNITGINNTSSLHASLDVGGISFQAYQYDGFNRLKFASTKWEGKRERHSSNVTMAYNRTHGIIAKDQYHHVFNMYTSLSENTDNQYKATYKYTTDNHQIEGITYQNAGPTNLSYKQDLKYDLNGNMTYSHKKEVGSNRVIDSRDLFWDAKDQLQAVVVGNQVSYYNYDYTGNRVVKSLGQSQSFAINGSFNTRLSVVDSYILYPNQYITVEQSGKYTKHYYSGSEKIASSLGEGLSFGAGNGTYRTQFETNLRGLFTTSNYDEPQFFTTDTDNTCEEALYYLKQQYEHDLESQCAKRLTELINSNSNACDIVGKMEGEGCAKNCDEELESIEDKFYVEKNNKCLELIKYHRKLGYTSCMIIDVLYQEGCLDQECLDEYNSWISFLEEHNRYDCLAILLGYVKNSGMGMCEAVKYMEEHSDCFDIEVIEDCYKEFISAYENCILLYGEECIKVFDKYGLEVSESTEGSGSIDYCKLLELIIRPPVRPTPEVPEPTTPTPGGGTEVDPVIPNPPVIPLPPYRQGKIWWYHSDHLGSSSYLTDINGIPTHYYGYLPFGELMVEHNNSNYDNVYKFNGKELDAQTGYYYYGARYYDPTMSVFLSVDPLADKYANTNPYTYVANNPITNIEIDGRFWWSSSDKKMADKLRRQYDSNLSSLNRRLTKLNTQLSKSNDVGTQRVLNVDIATANDQISANIKAIDNLDKLENSTAFGFEFKRNSGTIAELEFGGFENHSEYGEVPKVIINNTSDQNATHEINHGAEVADGKRIPLSNTDFLSSKNFSLLDSELESYKIEFGVHGMPTNDINSDTPLPTRSGLLNRNHVKGFFNIERNGQKNYPYKNLD